MVQPYDDPPVLTGPKLLVTREEQPVAVTLSVKDVDPHGKIRFEIFAAPDHGKLEEGNAPGKYTYTPATNFDGADHFIFAVRNDEYYSHEARVDVVVVSTNRPPVAEDSTLEITDCCPVALPFKGSDPDGDELTFALVGGVLNGSVREQDGKLFYRPASGFFGFEHIEFLVSDGRAVTRGKILVAVDSAAATAGESAPESETQ